MATLLDLLSHHEHNINNHGILMKGITVFLLIILIHSRLMFPQNDSFVECISNNGQNRNEPYVTAGDRTYMIGTQDGMFPDMGDHVKGEMGGLWMHPAKLIDGFWVILNDQTNDQEVTLSEAVEFINYPYGNRFRYSSILNKIEIDRFQFCPDGYPGIIVQYKLQNTTKVKKKLQFVFIVKTDLSPVWFSEKLGIKDAKDSIDWNDFKKIFAAQDIKNKWFVVWGSPNTPEVQPVLNPVAAQKTSGMGVTAAIQYDLTLNENTDTTLTFIFAGSSTDKDEAVNTYEYLSTHHTNLLTKKKNHYATIIERAKVKIPDQSLQKVYNWVKINMEWLKRDVPGIGRGLGGGLMEYPWWFGTETYSLQAAMATGDFDLVKQTLRLLKNHSLKTNGNGRIVHEVTTNGVVSNPGNSQETAQFIMCIGKLFEWTGDMDFAKEMFPMMKSGINWLLNDMDKNKNLFPEGYGIMEVYGLNAELIDVAVYTQQALESASFIAGVLNESEKEKEYMELASKLKAKLNEYFWDNEENSYCDFYGSREQAISAADGAITQVKLKGENLLTKRDMEIIAYYQKLKQKFLTMPDTNKGWFTNKNWVITTPLETGIAPNDRAIPLLHKIRKEHTGEYGPYLSAVEKQAMMTISTGVQAVSESNYGRTDEALWYMDKIVKTFNLRVPGSISEMMPDYGCFTIAWTSYGIVLPLIQHIFGIRPDAFNKTVVIEPHLPENWENISIENLFAGNNIISFSREKTEKGIEYKFTSKDDGWNLLLKLKELPSTKYYLNGKSVNFSASGFRFSGKYNHLLVIQ